MHRLILFLILLPGLSLAQQIHAHNDYAKPRPLYDAIAQQVDYIEADVWLVDGKLVVAHDSSERLAAKTLESMYLNPIVELFGQQQNRTISPDRGYTFSLVIDIKDKPQLVIPKLIDLLQKNLALFSRAVNPKAIQVVLSGNRPKVDTYLDFPPYLFFDGRPAEIYDEETLKRVALISDSFTNYSRWNGTDELSDVDREKLKRIIRRAHGEGKPIRFWAIPDQPNAWKQLKKLGVDVINTDKVAECRAFF